MYKGITVRGVLTFMVTPWVFPGIGFFVGGMGLIDPGPGDFKKIVDFWSEVVGFQLPLFALSVLGICKILCVASMYGYLGKTLRTVANVLALAPCAGAAYMHSAWDESVVPPIIMGSFFLGILMQPDGPLWESTTPKKD